MTTPGGPAAQNPIEPEPIDVEFSTAEPIETVQSKPGPGWIGVISASVFAALAGGAIGVVAGGTEGRYAQASEVAVDIKTLEDRDGALSEEIEALEEALREANARLETALSDVNEQAANEEAIRLALAEDVETLADRYRALVGSTEAAPSIRLPGVDGPAENGTLNDEPGESVDVAEQQGADEEAPLPMPAVTLAALKERLDAMEAIEPGTSAAPADLLRSFASLQERTEALEATDAELSEALASRQQALETLSEEAESLRENVEALYDQLAETETTLTNQAEADAGQFATLTSDLEALKDAVNNQLSNLADAELSPDEEALVDRADRVLALSALETAIRSGQTFTTELEALAIQLPANTRVTALRRFADQRTPSIVTLRTELARLKPTVASAGIPEEPSGQWAWLNDILSTVVTVREENTLRGEAASLKIDKAVGLLENDNLDAAISELDSIDGAQGEILKPWMERAKRRQTIDAQIARLRTDVLETRVVP